MTSETYNTLGSTRGLVGHLAYTGLIRREREPKVNRQGHTVRGKNGKPIYLPTDMVTIKRGPHTGRTMETGTLGGTLSLFEVLEQDDILRRASEAHKYQTPRFGWDSVLHCPCWDFPHNVHHEMPDGTTCAFSSESRADKALACYDQQPSEDDFAYSLTGERVAVEEEAVEEEAFEEEAFEEEAVEEAYAHEETAFLPVTHSDHVQGILPPGGYMPPQGYMVMMMTPHGPQMVFVQTHQSVVYY